MISGDRNLAVGNPCAFHRTLEGLAKEFSRIDIITPRVPHPTVASPMPNVYVHPSPWPLVRQPQWIVRKGTELVRAHGHAVMTVQDYPPFYNGIGARLLSRRTKTPYVLEVHHVVGWPRAANVTERIGRYLSRIYLPLAARSAAAVRVVNRTTATLLATWGVPPDTLHIVPSFYLDADALHPSDGPPAYDVAFCARLVANKGLFEFLRGMALVPEARACVIGDGPLRLPAEDLCRRLGIAGRVRFTGWLPAGEQIDAMRAANVFVMCSKSEGGPRVVLEAMACGVAVVATPVGIVPELFTGENGSLTTGTPDDIAAKTQALLSDDARRRAMGERARASVLPRFDAAQTLPAYAHFLQTVA